MTVSIMKVRANTKLPLKASDGAACYDLYASYIEWVSDNKVVVYLGIATEIPNGYKATIKPRSSFTEYNWIVNNSPGQIDSDYRGEWKIVFTAIPVITTGLMGFNKLAYDKFPYKIGDRVAQVSFDTVNEVTLKNSKSLKPSVRGINGFGSTGVN